MEAKGSNLMDTAWEERSLWVYIAEGKEGTMRRKRSSGSTDLLSVAVLTERRAADGKEGVGSEDFIAAL